MTKQEFDFWWDETQKSAYKWRRDFITSENSKLKAQRENNPELESELFYKGGEKGVYIDIDGTGSVEVGEYEGAYPHIGEAMFTPKHKNHPMYNGHPAKNLNEAFTAITERLGIPFLIDMFSA